MATAYQFENTDHFRSMLQNIDGYIYTVIYEDGKAVASYHSPKCLEITGYTPEEYVSVSELWINMVYKEDRERIFKFFDSRIHKSNQKSVEHRIYRKDGAIRWISNTFTEQFNEEGEITRRDGFIVDITDRKNAEVGLQEQYEFLQKLIDAIPNPLFYKDINGYYRGCNAAYEAYIGHSRDTVLNKTVHDIYPTEIALIFDEHDRQLYESGNVQVYEQDFRHADGSIRKIVINKAIFTDAEGKNAGIVGVVDDITELKGIEAQLKHAYMQLAELQDIVTKSPAVVFLRKALGHLPVEYVSDNVALFGYVPEEFAHNQLQYLDLIFPGDRFRFLSAIEKFVQHKATEFTQEYRIVLKNGKVCWVDDHTWIRYSDEGMPSHYHGIVIDISKRKQAVQLFRESIERYKALAENSYDLICEINKDAKVLYASPNFYETLGYDPDDLINKKFLKFLHPDDLSSVLNELKKGFGQIIHRFKQKSGEWLWFESAGKQYITAEGEKRGVIVSRDVTAKRKLEQQIIRSEKLLAIGEMSAMIAHEFRNSLTSIKMILQLMKESPRLHRRDKRSLSIALHSIYHMEVVIRQLLTFSQPASLSFSLENLNAILQDCLAFVKIQAQKKAIRISKRFDPDLPQMMLNSAALKETIINLLINATQAFDSSKIKIRRRLSISTDFIQIPETIADLDVGVNNEYFKMDSTLPQREIILEENTPCVMIKIVDNGNGIPDDHLGHIFEPFFTTKEKGSGLGLAIAKQTINSHGGIIQVKSRHLKGTSFKIYLPITSPFADEQKAIEL